MRLLILTQTVDKDDPILSFFVEWIEEFARRCESVEVICLREGLHTLPGNVRVHSLGKPNVPRPSSWIERISYTTRFLSLIYKLRNQYDGVFVHMNPEYVVLGALWWRLWRKRVVLWYVHKSITAKLRIAAHLVDAICTVAPGSIRLRSPRIRALGHGIDTTRFVPGKRRKTKTIAILTVGRIALSKGLIEILRALDVLASRRVAFRWTIVGAPASTTEERYAHMLQQYIADRPYANRIDLRGAVPHEQLPACYLDADVLVNISSTGGYDKVVLEALASGVPAISSSEPFRALLAPHGLFVDRPRPEEIADAIVRAVAADTRALRADVEEHHSLAALIPRIVQILAQ